MFTLLASGKKTGRRAVALGLCAALLSLDVRSAQALESRPSAVRFSVPAVRGFSDLVPEAALRIPADLGQAVQSFRGSSQTALILIQDAHVHEEAQRHLAGLLKFLSQTYGLKAVGVEGAEGDLDPHALSYFPNRAALEKAASYFLKEGRLTGSEYAAMALDPSLRLFGAEDRHLYEQNRELFFRTKEARERNAAALKSLKKIMYQLVRYVFAQPIEEMIRLREGAFTESRSLEVYLQVLLKNAGSAGIDLSRFPGISHFLELTRLESEIDFETAQKQMADLEKKLLQRFPGQIKAEVSKTQGSAREMRNWKKIREQTEASGLGTLFPEALKLARYYEGSESLGAGLTAEIYSLEAAVKDKLLVEATEKKAALLLDVLRVYGAFLELALTPEDADFFFSHRQLFKAAEIRSFLEPLLEEFKFDVRLPEGLEGLEADLPEIEKFYQAALTRDEVLVKHSLEKLQETQSSSGVLVAGGFHTAGIQRELRKRGISYLTLMPKMTSTGPKDQDQKYEEALSGKPLEVEEIYKNSLEIRTRGRLEDSRLQVVPWLMFQGGTGSDAGAAAESPVQPLIWLAVMLSVLDSENPAGEAENLLRSASSMPSDVYRDEVLRAAGEILGGVIEERSDSMRVLWLLNPGGDYQVYARSRGPESLTLLRTFGRRGARAAELTDGALVSLRPESYLVPQPIREELRRRKTQGQPRRSQTSGGFSPRLGTGAEGLPQTAVHPGRSELRTAGSGAGLEENQRTWLEGVLRDLNAAFDRAENYLEREQNVTASALSGILTRVAGPILEELQQMQDSPGFYAEADGVIATAVRGRLAELSRRLEQKAPRELEGFKAVLPRWNPETVQGDRGTENALPQMLSRYRNEPGVFLQQISLGAIFDALNAFVREKPSAARVERFPAFVRILAGALFFYGIPAGIAHFLLDGGSQGIQAWLAGAAALRAGYLTLTLAHEWTHVLAAAVAGKAKDAWTWSNLTASIRPWEWLIGLLAPLPRAPRVMIPELRFGPASGAHAFVRDAGWMLSGAVTLAAGFVFLSVMPGLEDVFLRYLLVGLVAGFAVSFFSGFLSDVILRKPQGIYFCGNYGAACVDTQVAPAAPDMTPVRERQVKAKRGQLPEALRSGYQRAEKRKAWRERIFNPFSGARPPQTPSWFDELISKMAKITVIRGEQAGGEVGYVGRGAGRHIRVQGHSRYGTSSAPAVNETQPHTWLPERQVPFWIPGLGEYEPRKLVPRVSSFVTHNGDFDAWKIYGNSVPFDQAAVWLTQVLGAGHSAKGDTPKLAGVVDYVHAQGMWDAALRFGFFEKVSSSLHDKAPPAVLWKKWGALADAAFSELLRESQLKPVREWTLMPGGDRDKVKTALSETLLRDQDYLKWVPESKRGDFLKQAVQAFLDHDLYTTARIVKSRSEGSFGVILTSSLHPDKTVLFAHSQPLFIGYDPELNFVVWASEAAALKASFTKDGRKRTIPFRFDLDQETGEIVELRMEDGLAQDGEPAQSLRIFSESLKRELTPGEVAQSGRMIDVRDNPLIDPLPDFEARDLVDSDLRDIPRVMRQIRETWQDPASFNRQSAQALLRMLVEKDLGKRIRAAVGERSVRVPGLSEAMRKKSAELAEQVMAGRLTGENILNAVESAAKNVRESASGALSQIQVTDDDFLESQATADILLVGFEVSQWFGEQFVSDLSRIFPALMIESVSSNKALAALREANIHGENREFEIHDNKRPIRADKNTIVFAVSQSGQTFPTLNAVIALRAALGERVFAVTGGLDTLMGRAVGQVYAKGSPFSARIFDNMSGLRPAEPSTVATAALQATLTEMLLYWGSQMKALYGERRKPLGMILEEEDFELLRRLRDDLNHQGLPAITGATPRSADETLNSPVRQSILKLGRRWARHVIEPAVVTGIGVLIVGVFSAFNLPFFPSSWTWVQALAPSRLLSALSDVAGFSAPELAGTILDSGLFVAANGFFAIILFPWLVTLALRVFQNRYPLLARTGKRTLVIGDIPYVHQTLEAYVSKIFSLSYGFASMDVHAGNPRDHYLPRFGHRIVRGLLSLLMEPDSRLASQQDAVSGVRMTRNQQEGVRNLKVGAEVFTLTRTWEGRPLKQQDVGLPVPETAIRISADNLSAKAAQEYGLTAEKKDLLTQNLRNFGEIYKGQTLGAAADQLGEELGLNGEPLNRFKKDLLRYAERQRLLENLYEKRFDSFERLVSAYVLFWEIGRRVSRAFRFFGLFYNMAGSQSRTRVATTRSPVADVNLAAIYAQTGGTNAAAQFSRPPVQVPFRIETSESIRTKSESALTASARTQSRDAGDGMPEKNLTSDDRRRLFQQGTLMALEKISEDFFVRLENLEDAVMRDPSQQQPDRDYQHLRNNLAADLKWFAGKMDPTRLEELKELFRRALRSSQERMTRYRETSTTNARRTDAGRTETFQRLRGAQQRVQQKDQVSRQIALTFEKFTKPSGTAARSELRHVSGADAPDSEALRAALGGQRRLRWISERERLLPLLRRAELSGIDLQEKFRTFSADAAVMEALDLPAGGQAELPGYFIFEVRGEEDLLTLKALISNKPEGVVIAVFAASAIRGKIAAALGQALASGDADMPDQPLLEYLAEKSRELRLNPHEVIQLEPLQHVKLKKELETALQLGALPLASGAIVIRSGTKVPGARRLRSADLVDQILKTALLIGKSA